MCGYFLLSWIVNALVLMVLTYLVPGVVVVGFYSALWVVATLSVVNVLVRPIILILTLPINILTLGLFTIVINGLMFYIVSTVVKGFFVESFGSAILIAALYSAISIIINYFQRDRYEVKVLK